MVVARFVACTIFTAILPAVYTICSVSLVPARGPSAICMAFIVFRPDLRSSRYWSIHPSGASTRLRTPSVVDWRGLPGPTGLGSCGVLNPAGVEWPGRDGVRQLGLKIVACVMHSRAGRAAGELGIWASIGRRLSADMEARKDLLLRAMSPVIPLVDLSKVP